MSAHLPVLVPGERVSLELLAAAAGVVQPVVAAVKAADWPSGGWMDRGGLVPLPSPLPAPDVAAVDILLGVPRRDHEMLYGVWVRERVRSDYTERPPESAPVWPARSWSWPVWHRLWWGAFGDIYPVPDVSTLDDDFNHLDPVTEWLSAEYNSRRMVSGSQPRSKRWAVYRDSLHPAATDSYRRLQPFLQVQLNRAQTALDALGTETPRNPAVKPLPAFH